MIYVISFENRTGNSNKGKIVVQANNDLAEFTNVEVFVEVTDPLGNVIKDEDFGVPDWTILGAGLGTPDVLIDIPTDGSAQIKGTYKATFWVQDQGLPGTRTSANRSYYYCAKAAETADVKWTLNCHCPKLTVDDDTTYPDDFTINNQTLTVIHPTIAGVTTPANSVGTAQVIVTPKYTPTTYQATISTELQKSTVDQVNTTWWEYYTYEASESFKVECDAGLCDIKTCIKSAFDKIDGLAAKAGGLSNVNKADLDKWLYTIGLLHMYEISLECKDYTQADSYYDTIKDVLNCECDCAGTEDNPVLIDTICGEVTNWATTDWGEVSGFLDDWKSDTTTVVNWRTLASGHLEIRGVIANSVGVGTGQHNILQNFWPTLTPYTGLKIPVVKDDTDLVCGVVHFREVGANQFFTVELTTAIGANEAFSIVAQFPIE